MRGLQCRSSAPQHKRCQRADSQATLSRFLECRSDTVRRYRDTSEPVTRRGGRAAVALCNYPPATAATDFVVSTNCCTYARTTPKKKKIFQSKQFCELAGSALIGAGASAQCSKFCTFYYRSGAQRQAQQILHTQRQAMRQFVQTAQQHQNLHLVSVLICRRTACPWASTVAEHN